MTSLVLLLAAALSGADTIPQPAAVVVHRQPALPIVALRLSVLADDPPGYAGAAHLVQHLVLPSLEDQVHQVGGRVEIQRNTDAMVYSVIGPASELPHLGRALRSALRPRTPDATALLIANHALAEERLAEWETAGAHVRSALRARIFPQDLPAAGTEASLARISPEMVRDAWGEMYRPERVSVVAVGDVRIEDVRRALSDLPGRAAVKLEPAEDTLSAAPLAPAEATQGWLGIAYPASDADPAALLVTARLLRNVLRERLPGATVETEHWWTHHGQALAAVVAAPEGSLPAARRTIGTAVSALAREVDDAQVRAAATGTRHDMLFYARTPGRMADVIGQFADRTADPDAAQRFYAALQEVDAAAVRQVLDLLSTRTPVRVDIPPQKVRTPS